MPWRDIEQRDPGTKGPSEQRAAVLQDSRALVDSLLLAPSSGCELLRPGCRHLMQAGVRFAHIPALALCPSDALSRTPPTGDLPGGSNDTRQELCLTAICPLLVGPAPAGTWAQVGSLPSPASNPWLTCASDRTTVSWVPPPHRQGPQH